MNKFEKSKRIVSLPGYSKSLPSKMYSGYMNVAKDKYIFYIFVEAEKNPEDAPLLFWTNGGPGCSGLIGFFEEMGPLKMREKGKLEENKYAWTKLANMVFVEQPAGVGFSVGTSKNSLKTNDFTAAKNNLSFVQEWYETYPEFKKNKMFLCSESYGGHYTPLWADEIMKFNKEAKAGEKIPLKGYFIGNPYVNYTSGWDDQVQTFWGHQRLSKKLWNKYKKRGCVNADRKKWTKKRCQTLSYELIDSVGKVNPYAISYPMCLKDQHIKLVSTMTKKNKTKKVKYNPCVDKFTEKYLNKKSVQKSLNVTSKRRIKWEACSNKIKYSMANQWLSTVPYIDSHLGGVGPEDLRVMIMSGTNDSICGTVGTQNWISTLKNIRKTKDEWKQYFVDSQPSGYIAKYKGKKGKKFDFVTVNGAGHEVPEYKPKEAFYVVKKFLDDKL